MKRTLTTIAAASMVLGGLIPTAFAATTNAYTPYKTNIIVNGQTLSSPDAFAFNDGSNNTTYIPIYYVGKALEAAGFTQSWDGSSWMLTTSNSTNFSGLTVGTGNASIYVNGTLVKKINTHTAKDPLGGASAQATTYMPIYYVDQILQAAGLNFSWDGTNWTVTAASTTPAVTGANLSAIQVSGGSNGDGSVSNPAVSLNGSAITLSTTLTDANGNPVPNTAVTFNVSDYGNLPSAQPTVENANGSIVTLTTQPNADQYTVYTDSTGVAKISMTGPSSQTMAYEVVATAPYAGSTGTAVSSTPAYVSYVTNNQAGIAPYAPVGGTPFNAAMGTPVPLTVILPPNASGQAQANVAVTLTVKPTGGAATTNAQFSNAQGVTEGQTVQVVTNSNGVATAYLTDSTTETVQVAVSNLPLGVNTPNNTEISFGQSGIAGKVSNVNISETTPNIGDNVTVSGQVQDAAGNPVPNGQILVTSPNLAAGNSGGTGHFAYVTTASGSTTATTTTFPEITGAVPQGTPATAAYGDLVTADANGNFSFVVTNPRLETSQFSIYGVNNGEVASGALYNSSLAFQQSTTLAYLSLGSFDSYTEANSVTSLTGLTAQAYPGGTTVNQIGADNGSNPEITDVYVEPQSSAGHHAGGALNGTPFTYTLSASNGGLIYSINGQTLASLGLAPSGVVSLNYTGTGFTVNGVTVNALTAAQLANAADTADFEVGVVNQNTGATTLTVQSGSVTSTAAITFNGGTPNYVQSFTPGTASINIGQSQQVSFKVVDINGNPVPNTAINIQDDQSAADGLWLTQVNGVTLSESLNVEQANGTQSNFQTLNSPIPLGTDVVNYNVSVPGVANWTNGSNQLQVYTDNNGQVSLTLQAGGLSYPTQYVSGQTSGSVATAAPTVAGGTVGFWSDINGSVPTDEGSIPLYIGVNNPTGITNASRFTEVGGITWGGGAIKSGVVTNGSITTEGAAAGAVVPAQQGVDTITVTAPSTTAGNAQVEVDGNFISVALPGTVAGVADTAKADATAIAVALGNNTYVNGAYNVTNPSDGVVELQQKVGSSTQPAVSFNANGTGATATTAVTTQGVTGQAASAGTAEAYTLAVTSGATNATTLTATLSDGTINETVNVPVTAGETAANIANAIASALNNDANVTAKYTVTVNGANVVVTANAPAANNTNLSLTVQG